MRFERSNCTQHHSSMSPVTHPANGLHASCFLQGPRTWTCCAVQRSWGRGLVRVSHAPCQAHEHANEQLGMRHARLGSLLHHKSAGKLLSGSPGLASIEQARRVSSASRLNPRTSWCEQVVRSAVALEHERKIARATEWLECGGCCCTDLNSPASTLSCTRSGVTHNCIHGRACGQRGPAVAAMLACGQGLNKSSSQVEASHPNGG